MTRKLQVRLHFFHADLRMTWTDAADIHAGQLAQQCLLFGREAVVVDASVVQCGRRRKPARIRGNCHVSTT